MAIWGDYYKKILGATCGVLVLFTHIDASATAEIASKAYVNQIVASIKETQANWTETDTNSPAFIQNKPDVYTKTQVDELLDTKASQDDVRFNTVPTTEPTGNPPEGQVYIWFN